MFKIIWILNFACLVLLLGIAAYGSGQDAAGRGALWFIAALFAAVVVASWILERSGSQAIASGIAIFGLVVALICVGATVRSFRRARAERDGSAFWKDPRQKALSIAIAGGDTAAMQSAISAGADPNAYNDGNMTPLAYAIRKRPSVVGALIRLGANPNPEREGVVSPLTIALTAPDPAFEQLVNGGANVNHVDMFGTPILFATIGSGVPARYEMLLARGADVHILSREGHTSLMAAVEAREWKIALDLLKRGVDPRVTTNDGTTINTMLERAQSSYSDNPEYQQVVAAIRRD